MRSRLRSVPVCLLAVGLAAAVATEARQERQETPASLSISGTERTVGKAPWEWTLDERIEARFDPERERLRQERAEKRGTPSSGNAIDGAEEPELLLPWQLFQNLISSGYSLAPENRELFRARYHESALFLATEGRFWVALEAAAADFIHLHQQIRPVSDRLRSAPAAEHESIRQEIGHLQEGYCGKRADALAAAREAFGAERFDRFLYEEIAPHYTWSDGGEPDLRQRLKFIEGGCR